MVEFALSTYLKSRPTIAAIVGTRVFYKRAPQKKSTQERIEPRITYRLMPGSTRHYHSGGASGLVEADIELMLTANTFPDARDLYDAVRNEIDGFSGVWGSTAIDQCMLSTPADGSPDPTQGDDTGFPTVQCVASVFYQESVPEPVND
jgi:hypothetical protein